MVVESLTREGVTSIEAADRLSNLIDDDALGLDGLYLRAVSNPSYETAFGELLQHGSSAPMRMTEDEQKSVQSVLRVQQMRGQFGGYSAAMRTGDGASGGYAVPAVLDPTILNTSDGVVNPLRQLARVVTITGANEWRGVSSEGVTASFAQELAEVEAGTVTLAQPTVTPERAHAFIPYSYELEQDFTTLQTELSRMLVDAKDQLEASQFLTGRGHTTYYEPGGCSSVAEPPSSWKPAEPRASPSTTSTRCRRRCRRDSFPAPNGSAPTPSGTSRSA